MGIPDYICYPEFNKKQTFYFYDRKQKKITVFSEHIRRYFSYLRTSYKR
jgi:hypothetical protein